MVDLDARWADPLAAPSVEARMRFGLLLLLLSLPLPAAAQITAPPDGLYEDFPSIFMQPSAPLTASPSALPRWVDVRTTGRVTTVTFEPEARVVWRIRWGANGPSHKTTLVDGAMWTDSRFTYDASGALVSKAVSGPGAEGGRTFTYTTDLVTHEVRTRTTTLATGSIEAVDVARSHRGIVVSVTHAGVLARRDRYDTSQRLLETRFYDRAGVESARLTYARDPHGALRTVRRRIGTHRGVADATHPDATLVSMDVHGIAFAPIERHEAMLLLGAATLSRDEHRGVDRDLLLDFAPDGCWMNEISTLHFDPTGLLVSASPGCICGFCVAASAIDPDDARRATGVQTHWTRGPWVRIDGVEVTTEHEVLTPDGPRPAGALRLGDLVLGADGAARPIGVIERVGETEPRLGVNLTTETGTFGAGDLTLVGESPRACPSYDGP